MKNLTPADKKRQELLELCQDLEQHIRLARDYGTTPGDIWLARSELNIIGRLVADLENKLSEITETETTK